MQINNVLAGRDNPKTLGRGLEALASVKSGQMKAAATRAGATNPAVSQILAQYDVTKITPQGFSEMIQKLRSAGALTDQDLQELSAVRQDLEAGGVRPDESTNLLDFYGEKLQDLQKKISRADPATTSPSERAASQQTLSAMQRKLDWLEKFSALHSTPGASGVNTLA